MEEMRSFGYICPACGKAVLHSRSVFALNAAAARMECECGKEALTAETDGLRFRLNVPCGVCGGHHQAECDAGALLHGRGIGLACPVKQVLLHRRGAPGAKGHGGSGPAGGQGKSVPR